MPESGKEAEKLPPDHAARLTQHLTEADIQPDPTDQSFRVGRGRIGVTKSD